MARNIEALENLRMQCATGIASTKNLFSHARAFRIAINHSQSTVPHFDPTFPPSQGGCERIFASSRFMHNLCSIVFNVKRWRGRQLSPEVVVTSEPPSVSSEFENSTSYLSCIPDLTGQIIKPPRACWRARRFGDTYECTWNLPSGSSPVCTRQSAPTTNNDKHHRWQSSALGTGLRSTSRDLHAK
jgi:hypothetical protein